LAYLRTIQSHTEVRDTIFIIQAQAYCSTCRRSAHQLASRGIALEACKDCHLLHHCSGCADSHSKAVCATYQVQNDVEQFRIQLFEDTGKASAITITEKLHTTHKPLASCAGWYDYFVNVSDKASIMDKITPDFSQLSQAATQTGSAEREFEESRRMFLLLATDTLTMVSVGTRTVCETNTDFVPRDLTATYHHLCARKFESHEEGLVDYTSPWSHRSRVFGDALFRRDQPSPTIAQ
jgi:splicing suppressor protein 51